MSSIEPDSDSGPHYSIQAASQEYAKAIQGLVRSSGINPTALDWQRFLVALDGQGNLIACGQVKTHADGSSELASVAVLPMWRKQGLGSALIERLIASEDGPLHLMCQSSLGPLYERFGFKQIEQDEMPKYFRRVSQLAGVLESLRAQGETLLIMRRVPSSAD